MGNAEKSRLLAFGGIIVCLPTHDDIGAFFMGDSVLCAVRSYHLDLRSVKYSAPRYIYDPESKSCLISYFSPLSTSNRRLGATSSFQLCLVWLSGQGVHLPPVTPWPDYLLTHNLFIFPLLKFLKFQDNRLIRIFFVYD